MSRAIRGAILPWEEAGWLERIQGWVIAELNRLNIRQNVDLELVRTRPWAAIARVSTSSGTLWFKEAAPSLAFEPALTAAVSRAFPRFTPRVLAVEGRWMLTRDAGVQLRELYRHRDAAPSWDDLLPHYSELQIGLAGQAETFLSIGVPDKRPAVAVRRYPELVDRLVSDVSISKRLRALGAALQSLSDELADVVPSTLIHEEVHEGNVFVRRGHARLIDWGEASLSHPFAGMVNTLRDIAWRRRLRPNGREMIRLRSVYLEPWTRYAPMGELMSLFDRGYLFGTLCRAIAWDQIIAGRSPEIRADYGRNALYWLEMLREGLDQGVRLGAS